MWGAIAGGGVLVLGLIVLLVVNNQTPARNEVVSATPPTPAVAPNPTSATPPAAAPTTPASHSAMPGVHSQPLSNPTAAAPSMTHGSPVSPNGGTAAAGPGAAHSPPATAPSAAATAPTTTAAAGSTTGGNAISRETPYANLADLIESVERAVVKIDVETGDGGGNGSGFVIDTEGTVVTNVHVIEGAKVLTARFQGDKTAYPIKDLYYANAKRDIAIVKIECPKEKLIPIGLAKDSPRKGEDLVAFGAPLGLDFTATQGIMSALRESADLLELGIVDHEGTWLQHSVPISPGNSGGPLVNMKGQVVGMNTMTLTIGQNLNFAISSSDIIDGISKKGAPKSLQTTPLPIKPGRRGTTPKPPKDIAGTDEAKKYLGKIKAMAVIMLRVGFDPTQRITKTVKSDLEDALEKAKMKTVQLQTESDAFMLVGMELDEGSGTVASRKVTISTICFYRDESGVVYKIWEEKSKVGSVALRLFLAGDIPKNLRAGIKSYFSKFSTEVSRSRKENEAEKPPE
jgi:S1-C subfamily serine protease